jgi:hypothetical protein
VSTIAAHEEIKISIIYKNLGFFDDKYNLNLTKIEKILIEKNFNGASKKPSSTKLKKEI